MDEARRRAELFVRATRTRWQQPLLFAGATLPLFLGVALIPRWLGIPHEDVAFLPMALSLALTVRYRMRSRRGLPSTACLVSMAGEFPGTTKERDVVANARRCGMEVSPLVPLGTPEFIDATGDGRFFGPGEIVRAEHRVADVGAPSRDELVVQTSAGDKWTFRGRETAMLCAALGFPVAAPVDRPARRLLELAR